MDAYSKILNGLVTIEKNTKTHTLKKKKPTFFHTCLDCFHKTLAQSKECTSRIKLLVQKAFKNLILKAIKMS